MSASYKLYYKKWNSYIEKRKNAVIYDIFIYYLLYGESKSKSLKWSIMILSLRDENIVNTDTLFGMYASDNAYIALCMDCPNCYQSILRQQQQAHRLLFL